MTRAINSADLYSALVELGSIKAAADRFGISDRTITRRHLADPALHEVVLAGLARHRELTYPHGKSSGYSQGCRCDGCRQAHARAAVARRAERSTHRQDAQHGQASTYTNWLCRCAPCTAAHSASLAQRRSA